MKKTIFPLLVLIAISSCMTEDALVMDYSLLAGTYTGVLVETDCDSAMLTKSTPATATVQATENGLSISCNTLFFEVNLRADTAGFALTILKEEGISALVVNKASSGYIHGSEIAFGVRDERGNHKNYLFQGNK